MICVKVNSSVEVVRAASLFISLRLIFLIAGGEKSTLFRGRGISGMKPENGLNTPLQRFYSTLQRGSKSGITHTEGTSNVHAAGVCLLISHQVQ